MKHWENHELVKCNLACSKFGALPKNTIEKVTIITLSRCDYNLYGLWQHYECNMSKQNI